MTTVAYVFPRSDLGGAEIATLRIIEAHDRARFWPAALVMEDGAVVERLRGADVPVQVAPLLPRLRSSRQRREARQWLTEALARCNAAIQHSVMAWTHALAAPAARAAGVPAVWYQHNRAKLGSAIDWHAALAPAAHIIANSRFTAGLQQRLNVRRVPIAVVYPPVAVGTPDGDKVARTRAALGAARDDILLVAPGRLQRWKGQDIAIAAFTRAAERLPRLKLALVGGSLFGLEIEYREGLERSVRDAGLQGRVVFSGFHTDMTDVYAAADIVVHAAREPEPYGLVVAEAVAAGRPVIAADAGGVREIVQHERTGLLVQPGDPAALADAMTRLANDPALRKQLAEAAAAARVVDGCAAAAGLEAIYAKLVS